MSKHSLRSTPNPNIYLQGRGSSELYCDVLVVGGGLGGVGAALALAESGRKVILTEEYEWLGGQLTSQAVPLDEHSWIEHFGCTNRYRRLRDSLRLYYKNNYPLTLAAQADPYLNPGNGLVSKICVEPKVAAATIESMLAPYESSGRLLVLKPSVPVAATMDGDRIASVTVKSKISGETFVIRSEYVLDATELGDVLPIVEAEYVTGFEAQSDTGEPSAPLEAQPNNQQAFSWCFAIDHIEGENFVIPEPEDYSYWRTKQPNYWGAPMLSLTGPDPRTLETLTRTFTPNPADDVLRDADQAKDPGDRELWKFRRIIDRSNFLPGTYQSDIVLVNWPMIDYLDGPLVGCEQAERQQHERAARRQSLSMLYWLQTEAPRPDGGQGFPGLRLRSDITQGPDGLAMAPYIRESRRLKTVATVTENDLSISLAGDAAPYVVSDSVGVGMYRIDLHPSTGGDNYLDVPSRPFEIPLGLLIPQRISNLLAAGKNIGSTHITNGAFRLHPTEWNIGESAGMLAHYCLDNDLSPHDVYENKASLRQYQQTLIKSGVELHWPEVKGY